MADTRNIIRTEYDGPKDRQGRPHGEGSMYYYADEDHVPFPQYPNLREYYKEVGRMIYRGHFEHGVRQGEGRIAVLGLAGRASKYEWYSEGEYDCCGRLIHPEHPEGSWQEDVRMKYWHEVFEGTWQDDMPLETKHWRGMPDEDDLRLIRTTCKEVLDKTQGSLSTPKADD